MAIADVMLCLSFMGAVRKANSFILNLADKLHCQHAPKSVNHVAIIAIDDIAVGGLHLETVARRP
jgi:hypothetical protein